jgi:type IV secretory pathway TrbD component
MDACPVRGHSAWRVSLGLVRQIAQRAPIFLPFGLRHLRAAALRQLPSTLLILLHNLGSTA